MKIITIILLFASTFFSQEIKIKTLQYLVNNKINKLPVVRMGSDDRLSIYFEVEAKSQPAFDIVFYFCNDNWEIYDNLLLEDIGVNRLYNVYINRLPITTEGAQYFVDEKFPNDRVKFNNSGKWMFFVVDPYDDEIVYEWGKFFVVDNFIELKTNISNWRREGRISNNNANDRVLNLKTKFNLPDSLTPFNIKHIEIIRNMELEFSTKITKDSFQKNRSYEWSGGNSHQFIIRDLEPGNEYRQTDLRDINKYQFPNTRAQFDGIEYSRFYVKGKRDLNGGFKLKDRSNQYSDYLTVQFQFRPPENTFQDIFLVGSFTNWEVLPWYAMNENDGLYEISLELKRGLYDYQYVMGNINDELVEDINWRIFEGNYWDTENVYSIFLYYETPEKGGYDKIIGYKQIVR